MSAGAWVQDIAQAATSLSSVPLTVGTTVVSDNLIIVRANSITAVGPTDCSISDNGPGYIWNQVAYSGSSGIGAGSRTWIFYTIASSGLASGSTITALFLNTQGYGNIVTASEYSGPFLPSPFDKTVHADISSSTAVASGTTSTLLQASELGICAVTFFGMTSQTLTGTNGWTSRAVSFVSGGDGLSSLDKVVSSTTGLQATGTFGTASNGGALLATFMLSTNPYPVGYPPRSRAWW